MPTTTTTLKSWKNNSLHLTEESRFVVENSWVEDALLVSGPGSDTQFGGLYYVKRSGWMGGSEVWCIDRLGSRGIDSDDVILVRALKAENHMVVTTYDGTTARTLVSEKGANIHDVRILDGKIYAVSTGTNEIFQLGSDGNIVKTWKYPGGNDAWHINGIDLWDGKLVACAFGRFEGESGYEGKTRDTGIVFEVETQKDVWTGLTGPHTPRSDKKGNKYICDSGNKRLVIRLNGGGEKVIDFKNAFPRGIAFGEKTLYVGLSFLTATQDAAATSKVVMIEPANNYEVTGEIELDIPEIYDIVSFHI